MCPACIGTAALIAGSASSTFGLAAAVMAKLRWKNSETRFSANIKAKESHDGQQQDGATAT